PWPASTRATAGGNVVPCAVEKAQKSNTNRAPRMEQDCAEPRRQRTEPSRPGAANLHRPLVGAAPTVPASVIATPVVLVRPVPVVLIQPVGERRYRFLELRLSSTRLGSIVPLEDSFHYQEINMA